ncbi:hypothetical protein EDB86DRAFT_1069295 [Lactarius hatsudake]|nr:hypothetical protein EDB86DRAFT_1069295 [Lactarius hatsudake]
MCPATTRGCSLRCLERSHISRYSPTRFPTRSSTTFSRHQLARVLPTLRCPNSSTCPLQRTTFPPPPRCGLPCSKAAPASPAALAPGRPLRRVTPTHRQYAVRRLASRGAIWCARRRTEGARTSTRAGCGRSYTWTVIGRAGNYGRGAGGARAVSRGLQMSKLARYCRTCRHFERPVCGLLCRPRLLRRTKVCHVLRCGHDLPCDLHWDRHYAASFFLRGRIGNWSEGNGYAQGCA